MKKVCFAVLAEFVLAVAAAVAQVEKPSAKRSDAALNLAMRTVAGEPELPFCACATVVT